MQIVPVSALPIQSFSIQLDTDFYDIVIRLCAPQTRIAPYYDDVVIVMDVTRNQVPVVLGQRVVVNSPVIPYGYLATGNFMWLSDEPVLLDYNQFGISQFLIYASQAELAGIVNAST